MGVILAATVGHFDVGRMLDGPGVPAGLRVRRVGLFAAACALGVAAGAVMVIPFLEALGQGTQLSRGGQVAMEPRSMITLILPNFWGRADRSVVPGAPHLVEGMLYSGGVALLPAVGGLVLRRSRTQLFFLALAVVSLLVVINLGPLDNLVRDVPGTSWVSLNRVIIVFSFAIAMLGAYGLDAFLRPAPHKRWAIVTMVLAATAPLVWFVITQNVVLTIKLDQFVTTEFFSSTLDEIGAVRSTVTARWLMLAVLVIASVHGRLAARVRNCRRLCPWSR